MQGMDTNFPREVIAKKVISMARGRPRLNRPSRDYGTPETVHKRMMLSPADPTLSTNPLDVLKSRGFISSDAHQAGCYFRALHNAIYGSALPPAIDMLQVQRGGSAPSESDLNRYETWYRDACYAIKGQSRASFDEVENIVIHERWPKYLLLTPGKGNIANEQKRVALGFAALLGWYKNKDRKVA